MSEAPKSNNEPELFQEDSLATFDSLIFRHYIKGQKMSRPRTTAEGKEVKGRPYPIVRIIFSPVENPNVKIATEVFESTFDKIRALRLIDDKANLKVSVEGSGKTKVVSWSNVSVL